VKCEFRILSGGRAGHREVFDKSYIGLGRHPLSDLRLDPEQDLDASTRHAAVLHSGQRYVVRDLGSRNGTFVNGQKIEADYELSDGDVMRLGAHGPEVAFHLAREGTEQVIPAVKAPSGTAPAAKPAPPATQPAAAKVPPSASQPPAARKVAAAAPSTPSATSILRAQVSVQAARFRSLLIVLGIVVVGAVAVVLWQGRTAQQQVATRDTALDSLHKELAALRVAQSRADSEASTLRAQLTTEHDPTRVAALQQRYAAVRQQQHGIIQAQGVNWAAINRANQAAVAMIYVRFADTTQMWTGTGFSVSPEGLLLTNRHVVVNDQGERPRDIAVQFSGTTAVLRARLEQVSRDADVATVKITDPGTYPVVQSLRSDLTGTDVGDPIALIGYPLGMDTPMGGTADRPVVQATLAPGTIGKILPDSLLQLDAYSGTGASGSPIFDRNGRVIGVEFGGLRESGGRIVLGLPIKRAAALLSSSSRE
jgi:S1-C subfamily serine protease